MLCTSEQARWPDGCSHKRGEMSEALCRTWAVRRTAPAPRCQHRPWCARAERAVPSWHSPLGMVAVLGRPQKSVPGSQSSPECFLFPSWTVYTALAIHTTPKSSKPALYGIYHNLHPSLASKSEPCHASSHTACQHYITCLTGFLIIWVMIPHCCL